MSAFPKDAWIKAALKSGYLIVNEDGSIWRAKKADSKGVVDKSKGYALVVVQTHKASQRVYFNMVYMGHKKAVLVNRVVAWRYHPNPLNLPQVNHKNGEKSDNSKDNLEWATNSDNEKHAHRTGLKTGRGSANSNAILDANGVLAIRASQLSAAELAAQYGVSRSTIINVLSGRTWKHI